MSASGANPATANRLRPGRTTRKFARWALPLVALLAALFGLWRTTDSPDTAEFDLSSLGVTGIADPVPPLVIEGANVRPMDRDTLLTDHTLILAGGRVQWMGPSGEASIPDGATRIDARGMFVLPGFADMHVHLDDPGDLARYVAAGVTTIRNMRGAPRHLTLRNALAEGRLLGPRLYTAGPGVGRGLLGDRRFVRVRSIDKAAAVVRAQHAAGYDQIKVFNRIPPAAFDTLVAHARRLGMLVGGHVPSEVGVIRAAAAGQRSFEHIGSSLSIGNVSLEEGARAIARARAWVGTIASDRDEGCDPPPPAMRDALTAARGAGVRLILGTDAGIYSPTVGRMFQCEVETLVALGVTPYEALVAATRDAGVFAREELGETEPFGIVAEGARADLVVLRADPVRDIRAVAMVHGTVLRGRWIAAREATLHPEGQ